MILIIDIILIKHFLTNGLLKVFHLSYKRKFQELNIIELKAKESKSNQVKMTHKSKIIKEHSLRIVLKSRLKIEVMTLNLYILKLAKSI
jgi:hypothetical protein